MTGRTRTRTTNAAKNTTEQAKKTPAKPAARKGTARKPAQKKTTAAKKTAAVPPVKPTPPSAWPEFITHKAINAYYQAKLHRLPSPAIRSWKEVHGLATLTFPSGASLEHTPESDAPFHVITPCIRGARHRDPIHTPDDLHTAARRAAHCSEPHLGAALQLAKRAAVDTQPSPALPAKPDPKPRALADELARSANTSDDTASMPLTDITAALEKPKEHPEP